MKIFILLSILLIVQADVIFNGIRYRTENLYTDLSWPSELDVDITTNTLYFNNGLKAFSLDINTKDVKEIKFTKGTPSSLKITTQAVDQATHEVYLGTTNGIYKYTKNSEAKFVGAKDVTIWHSYFNGALYYIDYPSQFVYTLVQGQSTRFDEVGSVFEIIIDNEDVMFFTNDTGFYSQTKGRKDAVLYDIDFDVVKLSIDRNGKLYFCSDDGIYEVVKHNNSVKKVVSIVMPTGLAFDKDNNMIYSDFTSIYRLLP